MIETIYTYIYIHIILHKRERTLISPYKGQEEATKHLGSRNSSQGWKLSNERRDG